MQKSSTRRAAAFRITRGAAAAATVAALAATAAHAQVTLSGIADAAVRHVDNEGRGSARTLASGSNSTSRLIVRGTEDMGGGLSAGFHLEHGIVLDTGTQAASTLFWDRRSTVSLAGRSWGEIRLGRDFVPSYVGWSRYDPFSYVGIGGSNNLVTATPNGPIRSAFGSGLNTTVRSSNAAQWLLPSGWGGLEGGVLIAWRENGLAADGFHRVRGARLGYTAGRASVSAAYTRTENNLTATGAFEDVSLGGQWNGESVRVSAAWRRFHQGSATQRNTLLGAVMPLGQWELKASYNRADLSGTVGTASVGANDARQLAAGAVYHLSKRSALYGHVSRVDNRGAATYAIPGGITGLAGGASSTGVEFGVRHVF